MRQLAFVALPAVVLGFIGLWIGSGTNGVIAAIAGVLGGAIAGYAALGVVERERIDRGPWP
jgi:hypothetical protein